MMHPLSIPLTALLITLAPLGCTHAEPVLHRAVEPAQILLDVTLKENNLTLFLTIPEASTPLLTPEKDIASLLTDSGNVWHPDPEAECSLNSHRIFRHQPGDSEKTSGGVQGFYDFECKNPHSLLSIRPALQAALPGLKQLNIWLTTDQWQNKQSLKVTGNSTIIVQPDF